MLTCQDVAKAVAPGRIGHRPLEAHPSGDPVDVRGQESGMPLHVPLTVIAKSRWRHTSCEERLLS